ncbi:MAG: InlB B-repeat-containing protein [Solirubrobacterales bacterium]
MRAARFSGLAIVALAVLALLAPGSASAAANHPFLGAGSPVYEDACGLALGPGGLYVSDYYHDAIDFPGGAISPAGGPCKLAFDAGGDLYVEEWHRAVLKYGSSDFVAGAGQVLDESEPTGLAVEASSGNVFVAHRTYVSEYSPAGAPVATIGTGHLEAAYGVAVSEYPATDGYLYVPDAATHTVKVFNPAASLSQPVAEIDGGGAPEGEFRYLVDGEIVVDNNSTSPSYGHVYVLDAIGHGLSEHPEAVLDEFNAAGFYRGRIAGFTDAEPSGVAVEAVTGDVYVTSGNSEGSAVFKYGPTALARTLRVTRGGSGGGTVTSSPSGIACGTDCAAEFNEGAKVTLFAVPDPHSRFAGWSVTGAEPCPGTGSCTLIMSRNVEVTATFEEPAQEPLTVSTTGAAGTVTSEPAGIECPSSCEEHFAEGRLVTLTAHPAAHSRFVEWLGVGCDESTQPICKITMTQAESITARFEPIPQLPLSVAVSGSGQGSVTSYPTGISCPDACGASFDEGSSVYLMAAPSPGSSFAGFSGGGCSGASTICSVTMGPPVSVTAEFTGTARGPAAPAAASLQIDARRDAGSSVALETTVSQSGTLLVAGPALRSRKIALAAGTATVSLRLDRHATRVLRRRHRLRTMATLGFVPDDPSVGSATAQVTLRFGRRARGDFDRKGR